MQNTAEYRSKITRQEEAYCGIYQKSMVKQFAKMKIKLAGKSHYLFS